MHTLFYPSLLKDTFELEISQSPLWRRIHHEFSKIIVVSYVQYNIVTFCVGAQTYICHSQVLIKKIQYNTTQKWIVYFLFQNQTCGLIQTTTTLDVKMSVSFFCWSTNRIHPSLLISLSCYNMGRHADTLKTLPWLRTFLIFLLERARWASQGSPKDVKERKKDHDDKKKANWLTEGESGLCHRVTFGSVRMQTPHNHKGPYIPGRQTRISSLQMASISCRMALWWLFEMSQRGEGRDRACEMERLDIYHRMDM